MSDRQSWPAVAWFEGPAEAPVVVLGNSLGTTAAVWDQQAAVLAAEFRLLRFELPGHGGSVCWPGPYSIEQLGAGLLALLDARGLERVGYCGISLGGMIGMWLASHAPHRVAALGLVCTSAYLPPAEGWLDRARLVRAAGLASVSAAVLARWFTPGFAAASPDVIAAFRAGLEQTDAEGYAGCCEAIAWMNLISQLPAVSAATLVLAGAEDPATPAEHGAAIAARIAGARLAVIPAAAHLAAVSSAGQVTSELAAHLRAATSPGRCWRAGR
jgi:3-oxoadipate enol-lactonase